MILRNKKGFTLIELLAVLAILAIVALIAVPVVTSMIKDSKKKTFESSANGLVESAKVYYSSKTEDIDFEGKTFKFGENENISGLNIKGKKPIDGEVVVNIDGEIKIYVTDGEYCAFKDYESNVITITEGKECVLKSETPIMSLVANKTTTNRISLVANCSYESGKEIKIAKYEFSKDGGKTWNSKVVNDKYLNYYTYSNLKQNTEYTFVARCVTTSGTSAQESVVTSPSQIGEIIIDVPDGWAREKEVTISYPKGRYKYQYQELDSDGTISEDKWITVEETENGSTHNIFKKTYTENKYIVVRVLDSAGNYVDSDSYAIQKIDRTPPVCGNWTGNSTWTNQNVTVKVACNETQDENNNISGCTASSYNVQTYSSTTQTASLSYTIKDNAGNETECSNSAVNVYVDKTVPTTPTISLSYGTGSSNTVSGTYTSGAWTNKDIRTTANSTDANSGIAYYQYSHNGTSGWSNDISKLGWIYSYNNTTTKTQLNYWITWQGAWSFYVRAVDNAGNASAASAIFTERIDKTAPTCTSSGGSTSWINSAGRTLVGKCADTGGSGCKKASVSGKTYDSNGNVSWLINWQGSWTNLSPGTVYDNAGNSVTCPANQTVKVDTTAPTCTSSGGSTSWVNSAGRTLVGTCADTGGSGCKSNVTWLINWSGSWTNLSPGTVYDNAGNSVACPANQTVKVDATAPTITMTPASGTYYSGNYVSLTCSDSHSGMVSSTGAYLEDLGYVTRGTSSTSQSLSTTGTRTATGKCTDNVGNVATVTRSYTIKSSGGGCSYHQGWTCDYCVNTMKGTCTTGTTSCSNCNCQYNC